MVRPLRLLRLLLRRLSLLWCLLEGMFRCTVVCMCVKKSLCVESCEYVSVVVLVAGAFVVRDAAAVGGGVLGSAVVTVVVEVGVCMRASE